ncbi:hypothetical protein T552_00950 [Pneumocystis carinii B80]|uniref:Membrane insertase YidC/Oxa/ALB C-terminal domain-containing protein n=1 Tax=Pneumocystis carinii (strain B80) TaxID=1408658 RepID=A0A0W4ZMY3_PNEC8|nr:hypothetical protein T552_00950 [Pneumocystis carinii B80]KTW29743.1 hypothetical protein T552_00950 [Pneumocystis carinii B80]
MTFSKKISILSRIERYSFFFGVQWRNFGGVSVKTFQKNISSFKGNKRPKYERSIMYYGGYYLSKDRGMFFRDFFVFKCQFSTTSKVLSEYREKTLEMIPENTETVVETPLEEVIHRVGDLKAMGFCNWTPVGFLQQCLEYIYVFTGLPWWASIATLTVIIRFCMVPLLIGMIRNLSTLALIHPEVQNHMKALKEAQLEGDIIEQTKRTQSIQKLFKEYKVNPLKSLAMPFIQMPVFISFYLACSRMASLPVPGLKNGGLGWFNDLSASDPYFILPFLNSSLMFINLELGSEVGSSASTNANMKMRNLFRMIILLTPLFTIKFQSAVFCYWITSNIFSLGQGFMLRHSSVRHFLNLPPLKPKTQSDKSDNSKDSEGFKSNFIAMVEGIKNTHRQVLETSKNVYKTSNQSNKHRPVDKTLEAYMLRKKIKYKQKQENKEKQHETS